VGTILAPTPLVAANFIILGKIITQLGTQYSRLSPKLCKLNVTLSESPSQPWNRYCHLLFVREYSQSQAGIGASVEDHLPKDVVCLIVQAIGGALAAQEVNQWRSASEVS
jgi:hypothetical protein